MAYGKPKNAMKKNMRGFLLALGGGASGGGGLAAGPCTGRPLRN